ncbi:hypothetical protein GCM10009616_35740 [Microlunatus lacustris]
MIIKLYTGDSDHWRSEHFDAAKRWSELNGINPNAATGPVFVDLDSRVIYWCEVVPPAGEVREFEGHPFPDQIQPGPDRRLADMGEGAALVVQRETPLVVDPPQIIRS